MRRVLPYITLLLVYLMTPGSGELTEDLFHYAFEGPAARASTHTERESQAPEHGCSGPYHVCKCHQSTNFMPVVTLSALLVLPVSEEPPPWYVDRSIPIGFTGQVFRPPIA